MSDVGDRRLGVVRRSWNHLGGFDVIVRMLRTNSNPFGDQINLWKIIQKESIGNFA